MGKPEVSAEHPGLFFLNHKQPTTKVPSESVEQLDPTLLPHSNRSQDSKTRTPSPRLEVPCKYILV